MSVTKHHSERPYCQVFRCLRLLAVVLTSITAACSHNSSDKESDASKIVIDTVAAVAEPEIEAAPDTVPAYPESKSIAALKEFMRESEDSAKYAEGIIPLVLEQSPEYAYKLLCNKFDKFIVVDKSRMKVLLFDKYGRTEKTYGMACAKNYGTKHKKADSRTPEGFFSVEGIYDSTEWLFTDDNGVTSKKKGQFGPRFIRLRIPNTSQIGIHGTCAPWSIGSRASHGCIRIKNENILELVELVEPGMPVIIVPGRKDMEQNRIDGVDIPWIPTTDGSKKPAVKVTEQHEKDTVLNDSVRNVAADSIVVNEQPIIQPTDSIDQKQIDIQEE